MYTVYGEGIITGDLNKEYYNMLAIDNCEGGGGGGGDTRGKGKWRATFPVMCDGR